MKTHPPPGVPALEPVRAEQGFSEVCDDSITAREILSGKERCTHEYRHETR
jgi:hypothetical protein